MEIFKLFGSVFIDNEKANKSIDATDAKGKGLTATLGGWVGTAAKAGAAVIAGATAAGGAMLALLDRTSAAADEIDKLSERTGINREELQRWKYAAGQSGADIEKLEVGMKTLSDIMDRAASGNDTAAKTFDRLGISLEDLRTKSQSEIFDRVMSSLADMEQGAARNALGNDLLGKSYTELLPLLNAGSEGMDALKQRADELGIVLSEEGVKANVVFGDTMSDVKQALGAVFTQVGTALLPVFQKFLDWVLEHIPEIKAIISAVFTAVTTAVNFVVNEVMPPFMNIFQVAYDVIMAIWRKWGGEFSGETTSVFETVKAIIQGAFSVIEGLLKVFGGVLTGDFSMIKEGISKIWTGLWDGMTAAAKGAINLIIKAINGLINGLNKIKFSIPSWVPLVGGKEWGFNIKNIPYLAEGGEILRSGRVMVGEAGPEVLDLPRGAVVRPLAAAGAGSVNVFVELDGYTIVRAIGQPLVDEIRLKTGLTI